MRLHGLESTAAAALGRITDRARDHATLMKDDPHLVATHPAVLLDLVEATIADAKAARHALRVIAKWQQQPQP